MTRPRQIVLLLVLVFVLYAIYTNPTGSADTVREGMGIVGQFVQGLGDFASAVMGG